MKISFHALLKDTILSGVTDHGTQTMMSLIIITVSFLIASVIIDLILRNVLIKLLNRLMLKTNNLFLSALAETRIFNVLSLFSFAIVFDIGSAFVSFKGDDVYTVWFANFLLHIAYLVYYLIATWSLTRAINAFNLYYERRFDSSHEYPIYGYIKMAQFAIWCVAILLYISMALNKSPLTMLTGIGAISAFVILIFKDTFLGLVSSIQATANQIVKLGDWVNIPKYSVDGEVIYISINTLKVRNWDNTITSMPTFALTIDAIHNWQSMVQSGGRRIFRAIYLDVKTIRRCDNQLLHFLRSKYPFIASLTNGMDDATNISNLSLFRMYMNDYLSKCSLLNHEYPNLVRYLAPTPHGLPLQVYAFSTEVYLEEFEETQSQIFEYLFLVLHDFDLEIFQASAVPAQL